MHASSRCGRREPPCIYAGEVSVVFQFHAQTDCYHLSSGHDKAKALEDGGFPIGTAWFFQGFQLKLRIMWLLYRHSQGVALSMYQRHSTIHLTIQPRDQCLLDLMS